jgi:hypothetical protein
MKNLIFFVSVIFLSIVSNTTIAQLPGYIPDDSLVGWWPFKGNANDLSLNANNGVNNGAQLANDRFGNEESAYDFVDPADHILVESINQASFNGDFTISAWVNFRNFYIDYPHIMSGMNNYFAFHGQGPTYYPNNDKVGFYTTSAEAVHQGLMVSQNPLSVNSWHNIIVNKKGSEVTMYIDNQLSDSNTHDNQLLTNGEGLYFGNFYLLNSNIDGMVDDIGIWKRSLTQDEMNNLYYMPNTGIVIRPVLKSFRIYPNPAREYFTICDFTGIAGAKLFVALYNTSGQMVLYQEINRNNPVIRLTDIHNQGIYTIKISNTESSSWYQKLLIQF